MMIPENKQFHPLFPRLSIYISSAEYLPWNRINQSKNDITISNNIAQIYNYQVMGKRAPKAEKTQKAQKAQDIQKVQKVQQPVIVSNNETKSKNKYKKDTQVAVKDVSSVEQEDHFQVFSPKFNETLETFKNFYNEVLSLKSKEQGTDLSQEFAEVSKRVSDKLEEESSKIMKTELADLQNWLSAQKDQQASQIKKIQQAYKSNQNALSSTGFFSSDEIKRQLLPIQSKIDQKQAAFNSYDDLLNKSRSIYE